MGCNNSAIHGSFENRFVPLLDKLPITEYQREHIKSRYVREVIDIEQEYKRSVVLFIGLTNLITISGILVTSLTTLTKAITVSPYWQDMLQWIVFTLGLSLTLANGWMTTFGIYKKYVINDVTLDKMRTEGWAFLAGVNRYELVSLDERVNIFTAKIEQIITKTTIVQMGDNTAGVNVNDVLDVTANTVNTNDVNTVNTNDNIASVGISTGISASTSTTPSTSTPAGTHVTETSPLLTQPVNNKSAEPNDVIIDIVPEKNSTNTHSTNQMRPRRKRRQ